MALQTGIFADVIDHEREQLALERRSSLENPQTPLSYPAEWLLDIFNGGRTDSGIRISELTAFQCITFLSGVDLISGKISSLPAHIYERILGDTGRTAHRIAYEHDYYDLCNLEPNVEMSWQTFLRAMLIHCLAWSNGFSEIQRDDHNGIVAFWPRNPAKTRPRRMTESLYLPAVPWRPFPVNLAAGELVFQTTDGVDDHDPQDLQQNIAHGARLIPAEDMIHIPGISFDGRIGQSAVWLARQTLGIAMASEKFGAKYFANFAKPGGILESPVSAAPGSPAYETARRSWQEAQGGENAQKVAVMPQGYKFTPLSHNPQEAQSVEVQTFIRTQIGALLHIPIRMLGDTSKSSRASTEQENQELLDYTLSPWTNAVKQEFKRKVFPHSGVGRVPRNRFYLDFDTIELTRPDAASREKFYASGKQWGYLNTNDVRSYEKLNPIADGWAEQYWMPINMTLVTTPIDPTHQDGGGEGEVPQDPATRAYSGVWRDAFGRLLTREKRDTQTFAACFGPVCASLAATFRMDAQSEMRLSSESREQSAPEIDRFLADYYRSMEKRASDWSIEKADELASAELTRAIRAIRVAVYRETAAIKAKEPVVIR